MVFEEVPAELRAAYFSAGPAPYRVSREVRRLVRFEAHDLLRDPAPGDGFALIACRMGLLVARDARSVGINTTSTVVQSIVWVIVLDAVFAVVFQFLRI
jgi:hypothetical protein